MSLSQPPVASPPGFGERRLADFISAATAVGDPAPETVRRLMRRGVTHQVDQLQDDASIVVLEWLTGEEHELAPQQTLGQKWPSVVDCSR